MATDDKRHISEIIRFTKDLNERARRRFDWSVDNYGAIRGLNTCLHDDPLDPLCALAFVDGFGCFHSPYKAADKMGMTESVAIELVEAFDNRVEKKLDNKQAQTTREVRKLVTDALGLKGER